MDAGVLAAGVGLVSAFVGGLLTAISTRNVEGMRVRAGLIEKAEERKLAAIEAFLLAVNAWRDWLVYMEEQGDQQMFPVLNERVKARDDSYRRLLLLASEALHAWLTGPYRDMEYEFKVKYALDVRNLRTPDGDGLRCRDVFSEMLGGEMLTRMRPEVATLRDPV